MTGAVSWLGTRPEVDPGRIAALGLSMGGEVALTAAASGTGLAAVVAEGASSRVPADLVYLPADASGLIKRLDGEIMWALAGLMTDAAPPIPLTEAVAAADVPILLIVGQAADEVLASRSSRSAAPSTEVWELPDTPHIESLSRHPQGVGDPRHRLPGVGPGRYVGAGARPTPEVAFQQGLIQGGKRSLRAAPGREPYRSESRMDISESAGGIPLAALQPIRGRPRSRATLDPGPPSIQGRPRSRATLTFCPYHGTPGSGQRPLAHAHADRSVVPAGTSVDAPR